MGIVRTDRRARIATARQDGEVSRVVTQLTPPHRMARARRRSAEAASAPRQIAAGPERDGRRPRRPLWRACGCRGRCDKRRLVRRIGRRRCELARMRRGSHVRLSLRRRAPPCAAPPAARASPRRPGRRPRPPPRRRSCRRSLEVAAAARHRAVRRRRIIGNKCCASTEFLACKNKDAQLERLLRAGRGRATSGVYDLPGDREGGDLALARRRLPFGGWRSGAFETAYYSQS